MNLENDIYSQLIDVTHLIVPEENISYLNDAECSELYLTCLHLMEEYINLHPTAIAEEDFDENFDENIQTLIDSHFETDIHYNESANEEVDNIIIKATIDFFKQYIPPRSYDRSLILSEPKYEQLTTQIDYLRSKPQPVQRTKEWYEFRHNLITASNAFKAYENQTIKNQLIYEKCQPLNPSLYIDNTNDDPEIKPISTLPSVVNVNTTLHWGQKYEPLSVMFYEHTYNTKIEDFGCIQHDKYSFLGASPDGINVDLNSKRYGRMLEIKNIVNRHIDGIPKKEYWIQMQLQMEVCNLDECDFLETRFTEYENYEAYLEDTFEDDAGQNQTLSKDGKMKGLIIYFHTKEGKPHYAYKPLELTTPQEIDVWESDMLALYLGKEFNYTYMSTLYWKLEYHSCVLVCRNKKWFNDTVHYLEEIWSTIEHERQSGFEHRAPNRKTKKLPTVPISSEPPILGCLLNLNNDALNKNKPKAETPSVGCLLNFNKEIGKITIVKKD